MLKKVLLLSISLGTISNSISMDIPKPSIMPTIVNRSMTYIYGIGTVVLSNYILKTSISNKYIRYGISSAIGLLTKISSQYILNEISFISAKKGYASLLKTSYILGANINAKDNNKWTPLHIASFFGHKDIVEYLISKGADVNANNKWTPLHIASFYGYKDIVECLISKGADKEANDKFGRTPLRLALERVYPSIVEYLITKGADINAKDKFDWTPLHYAVSNWNIEMVQLLLSKKDIDINVQNHDGETPISILLSNVDLLHSDILSNWKLITWLHKYMKENGAYTGVIKYYEQENKLITAAMYGDIDTWRDWDAHVVDEKLSKEWLQYALFIGAHNGNTKFFRIIHEILTQYDRDIDLSTIRDNNGDNVIDAALYSLDPEMIREIMSVNEDTFNNHLNTNVDMITLNMTDLFSDQYINLVREINNPRYDTNINKLIEEINDLIGNYVDICRYLIYDFNLDGNIILKNLIGIINVDTTLTGTLAKHNVKGQNIYDHINSLLSE